MDRLYWDTEPGQTGPTFICLSFLFEVRLSLTFDLVSCWPLEDKQLKLEQSGQTGQEEAAFSAQTSGITSSSLN